VSGRSHRRIESSGGANERPQRFFIRPDAPMEINDTPDVVFEASARRPEGAANEMPALAEKKHHRDRIS